MENPKKVLLAEDEEIFLIAIEHFLKDDGFEVFPVDHSEELLAKAESADILVVDARLPREKNGVVITEHLEGVQAVSRLLRENKLRKNVPVIFISVLREDDDLSQRMLHDSLIRKERRYCWLQKPFESEYLSALIQNELSRAQAQ